MHCYYISGIYGPGKAERGQANRKSWHFEQTDMASYKILEMWHSLIRRVAAAVAEIISCQFRLGQGSVGHSLKCQDETCHVSCIAITIYGKTLSLQSDVGS